MSRRVVGLDIGSAAMRAVEVVRLDGGDARVLRCHEIELPPGAARYGEVSDPVAVAASIRRLWKEGGFRSRQVVLGVGGQRMMARELTVPKMPMKRIRETLPFQVQDMLPMAASELLLDFYPVREQAGEGGAPMIAGLLVAALQETVRANIRAAELAGLSVQEVDVLPFALVRAMAADLDDGIVALVEVGASATTVIVLEERVPLFIRVVPRGGNDLTDRLATELHIDGQKAEAVKLGLAMGFEGDDVPEYLVEAALVIETYQRELLDGLRNTLGYYETAHPEAAIERIVLTGAGARITGFANALAQLSGVPVRRGRVTVHGRGNDSLDDHSQAAAYGLALGVRA